VANFQIRVVLQDASWDHYQTLHAAMTHQGFSRTIQSADGVTYQLPDAEYRIAGAFTLEAIGERVKAAASTVGRRYSWLANETTGARWAGLEQAP
jgi:hypothetical protein